MFRFVSASSSRSRFMTLSFSAVFSLLGFFFSAACRSHAARSRLYCSTRAVALSYTCLNACTSGYPAPFTIPCILSSRSSISCCTCSIFSDKAFNGQCRLGRDHRFADQSLQDFLCPLDDIPKQPQQPAMFLHGAAGFVVYMLVFELYDLRLGNPRYQRHIRRSVPVLPCCIVRLNLRRLRVVLPDLFGGEIYAARIKDL